MEKFIAKSWTKFKRVREVQSIQSFANKTYRRFNRWEMSLWAVWYLALTILVAPWRNSFSYEDSVYYKFAESLSHFKLEYHILNFVGAWPQTILASLLLHLPIPGIVLLNCMTWIVFGVLSFVIVRDHLNNAKLALAFFSFPVFIQMGVSFMPDIYVCLLLYLVFRWFGQSTGAGKKNYWPLYILTILLMAQYQPAAAFVFFWSLFLALDKKHIGWHGCAATLVAIMVYSLLPKSDFQFSWPILFGRPFSANNIIESFAKTVQFLVVIGLFLIPLFPFKPKRGYLLTTVFMHFYALGIIYLCSKDFIFAPSLPTQFLTKAGVCLFLSAGVWGWSAFFSGVQKSDPFIRGSIVATIFVCLFAAFTNGNEIRYLLPIAIVWFVIFSRSVNLRSGLWGHTNGYVIAMMFFAILFNLYNLNTTDAKWSLARDLISKGNDPRSISAGKSWELLNFEPECTRSALKKVTTESSDEQIASQEHILTKVPNAFEDQTNFRFILKPYYAMGMKINTLSKTSPLKPSHLVNYKVLGISNAVAVFDTGAFVLPWCFQ